MKYANYMLEIFPLIIEELEKTLLEPQKCWVKSSFSTDLLAFKKLKNLSDNDKKVFVYNIVLIHGVIDTFMLKAIEYKRSGTKAHFYMNIEIPFKTDEQKEEYIGFRNWLLGIKYNNHKNILACA